MLGSPSNISSDTGPGVDLTSVREVTSTSCHIRHETPVSLPTDYGLDMNPLSDGATLATLQLLDGSYFIGYSFGAYGTSVSGECVFQTGMTGYTESLTDPSYRGQILILTNPLCGNYGVPFDANTSFCLGAHSEKGQESSPTTFLLKDIPEFVESSDIHVTGLIVASYCNNSYSHYLAKSSLGLWLETNGIPAIYGVDTRALTKRISTMGSSLGKILFMRNPGATPSFPLRIEEWKNVPWSNPNEMNLVSQVSCLRPKIFLPDKSATESADVIKILAIDVGIKYNQIRCLLKRGVLVKVVPWDYRFSENFEEFDGLFISNGPGDPSLCTETVDQLRICVERATRPIFGICLGHQLLALSSGLTTSKMLFGNRGCNIPCVNVLTGQCYVTSQNHGFAVDQTGLTSAKGWRELFRNDNDNSNEGIIHESYPFFSVQFHPEGCAGPQDTEFLFDVFLDSVRQSRDRRSRNLPLLPVLFPQSLVPEKMTRSKKILILGCGGLSIGQAGEFDYSGSQAIKALKEEGIYTIVINPNIATVQTSKGLADKVYFLPVTVEFVRKVIEYEKPTGILVTFGGQTALNVAVNMKDEFEHLGVKVLGTPIETIILTEDRQMFAQAMASIGEKCAISDSASTVDDAVEVADRIGYPVIVRAAFALGGLGSGFATNEVELGELCARALTNAPQVLVEKSMKGWKEIEIEVVRDCVDNCIAVCNMENFDPLGIHTGDSIVVAPCQTLSDNDYQRLRTTAIHVIRHLGVVGECNIQYALDPHSDDYCIIEVNARLSRSSALASKATGYPLAFVAAKLALNIPLTAMKNSVTRVTSACFEPSLDFVVVKIPRWDLSKFNRVSLDISSSMKSVGEVMAIGRNFEEAFQKAVRAVGSDGFTKNNIVNVCDDELSNPTYLRIFALANALRMKEYSVDRVWQLTRIDKWFLRRLQNIANFEFHLRQFRNHTLPVDKMRWAKILGFSDKQIARQISSTELAVRQYRTQQGIVPVVKQIDTVAAEFPAFTNYLYMTYCGNESDVAFHDNGTMVLGSGVYRIGSSVEFDSCCVRAIRTLRNEGRKTIMLNFNPETVSTDYDEADRLYFENITLERVMDIYSIENANGVVISMGGQTPNNIALALHREKIHVLGTSPIQIDEAENRYKFSRILDKIGIDQPQWREFNKLQDAIEFCNTVTYPVLVRPSYVLSGACMNVVYCDEDLSNYLERAATVSREHPIVISKFIQEAKEIELDAVAVNGNLVFHVISEHIENAGVHSGDATLVLPPQDLDPKTVAKIEVATRKIAKAFSVTGPFNIQFIAKDNEIKVIECNLRASRSFPFVSKVLGVDLIEMATKALIGAHVDPYPCPTELREGYVGVKVPQFSFNRLLGCDPVLGVEMASTGEVACFGKDKFEAYLKALVATGFKLPKKSVLLSIGSFKEKTDFLPSARKLSEMGYTLFATPGTGDFLTEHGIVVEILDALQDEECGEKSYYSLYKSLASKKIDLFINMPSNNNYRRPPGFLSRGYKSRRMAIDNAVPLVTNIKCAKLLVESLFRYRAKPIYISNVDYKTSQQSHTIPGLVDVFLNIPIDLLETASSAIDRITSAGVSGGFTIVLPSLTGVFNSSTLLPFEESLRGFSRLDFAPVVFLTPQNVSWTHEVASSVGAVALDFARFRVQDVFSILSGLNLSIPLIIIQSSDQRLSSILFVASMTGHPIHIYDVADPEDLELITLSRSKGMKITFGVAVHRFFEGAEASCNAFWNSLAEVDCFSVGFGGDLETSCSRLERALPLLLRAVDQKRLTMKDLVDKFHSNPITLFRIPHQRRTCVELSLGVEMPSVQRVVIRGATRVLDDIMIVSDDTLSINIRAALSSSVDVKSFPKVENAGVAIDEAGMVVSPVVAKTKLPEYIYLPEKTTTSPSHASASTDVIETIKPIKPITSLYRQHILSVDQFSRKQLHDLFTLAHCFQLHFEAAVSRGGQAKSEHRKDPAKLFAPFVLCNLFYEPSTRTTSSFEAAFTRLGGSVINVCPGLSSCQKGESVEDTVQTLACYSDVIVMRHPVNGKVSLATTVSKVPIINAGDGMQEHPTQALLDVYTIRQELGTVNGLIVTIVGDLKTRTVHSLVRLLSLYDVKLNYVSPTTLELPDSIVQELSSKNISQYWHKELSAILPLTDVLYLTRVEREACTNQSDYDEHLRHNSVDAALLESAKTNMIIMHPLPRSVELDREVDYDSRAAYFRQTKYGMYVRMALLSAILTTDHVE